jgi:hypothetical protein
MRGRILIALAAAAWPASAPAQGPWRALDRCDALDVRLDSVSVGADLSGVRTFYDGQVTLLLVDQSEPACCSYGIAIIMPAEPRADEPGGMRCWAKWGFAGIDLRGARSTYDPRQGLTLAIPTLDYDPETGASGRGEPIRLRIDAGRGTIVDLAPPR